MFRSSVRQFVARARARLFPGPFAAAGVALALFLGVSLVSRVGLALFNGEAAEFLPWRVAGWLAIGTVYDLAAGAFWLLPFALAAWLWPARRLRRGLQSVFVAFGLVSCAALALTLASEFVFWNEFSSRFNFIAVDYLIYTREVIGNIRESYPMTPIVLGLAALAAAMAWLTLRPLWRAGAPTTMTFGRRSVWMAAYALAGGAVVPGRAAELEGVQRERAVAAARGQRRLGVLPRVQHQRDRLRPVLPRPCRTSGRMRSCARSSPTPGRRTSRTTRRCRSSAGSTAPARRRSSTSC